MLSENFRRLAAQLTAANTVSVNGTRQAADLLQPLWEHAGLAVRRQVVDGIHVNLLGGPGAGASGRGGVLLVTHLDTVPSGPLEKWQSDPWTLTERDGFFFGLGVADVKLDALCKAEAARRLQGRRGKRPFWLLGTFGEEVGLRGARHFAQSDLFREIAPSQVLCGEPSELRIIHAHKGYAVVRCTVRDLKARLVSTAGPGVEELEFEGKAAHSSTPRLGVNAIQKALAWARSSNTPVLAARGGTSSNVVPASCTLFVPAPREKGEPAPDNVKFLPPRPLSPNLWRALATAGALEELWQQTLPQGSDARFDPPGAVGGLNLLGSADPPAPAPDAVYGIGEVSVQLDARLLPDQDPDALIAQFTGKAREWVEQLGRGELEVHVSAERNAGGMALSDDAPLVRAAGSVLARHGLDPKPRAKPTSTEAGVFARAGCEAIVFGPGRSTGNAHTANERIEMAQLEKACDLYESLLVELCACT
jgi:acetylornithine deacetylase/succinyl-diaminopimelate desuccinylase-like protein